MPYGVVIQISSGHSFFNGPPECPVRPYNSEQFKKEFNSYMSERQTEYNACLTQFGQFLTWFPDKLRYKKDLFALIEQYEDAIAGGKSNDIDSAKNALATRIHDGAYEFFGALEGSNMSCLLRQWYYRLVTPQPTIELVKVDGQEGQASGPRSP